MSLFFSDLLRNHIVQAALAIVGVIAAGSVAYYLVQSHEPALAYAAAQNGTVSQSVSATGTVSPLQNPTLTFTAGGRITYINAAVGQKVGAGTVLASVDSGVLVAERAAAQANLSKLQAGARPVDLAGKQTAVATAQTSQAAAEAVYPATIQSARSTVESAVASTDSLFKNPNSGPYLLSSYNRDSDARNRVNLERQKLNDELDVLAKDAISQDDSSATLDHKASETLAALQDADTYLADLANVINDAHTEDDLSSAQIGTAITTVSASRASVDAAIRTLTQAEQQNAVTSLQVTSAQNDLSLAAAPARSEDVAAAQAQVASIDAQIRNNEIVAPFSGTIASVNVKSGDVIAPNTDAISLIPNGTSEVDTYLSEQEVAMLMTGDLADVTLDAFGSGTLFPATVSSIDKAPSTATDGTSQGYKVVLVFKDANPSIGIGMHANAVMHGRSKQNVLTVPRTSLITDGTKTYVLVKNDAGAVKTPVTVGLVGADSVEILSGIKAGDLVASVGTSVNS